MQHYLLASTVQHLTRLIHLQYLENTWHSNNQHADSVIRDVKNLSTEFTPIQENELGKG
jgi:hypothetical protein